MTLIRFDEPGTLRSLNNYRSWDDMGPGGKACGLRLQACAPVPLAGGEGSGRIATAFEIDTWSMTLEPDTHYGVWLTDSSGAIVDSGYHLGVFESYDSDPYRRAGTPWPGLTFETHDDTSYAFTVFANEAKDEDYGIHVQAYVDDYGEWEYQNPPSGTVQPNVWANGQIEVQPDVDQFLFPAVAGKTYALYCPDQGQFSISLNGDWSWPGDYWGDFFTAPANGNCRVRVVAGWNYDPASVDYQFLVSEFDDDADNDRASAIPLEVGGPAVANDLKAPGDQDYFVFNVASGTTYRLTSGAGLQLRVYLNQTWYRWSSSTGSLDFPAAYTGPCYVAVRANPATGAYTIGVEEAGDPYADWAADFDWGELPNGPGDDADGDGFTNDQERIAGTDPTREGDLFRASAATTTPAGDGIVLGTALPGRVYTARYTTDLRLDWSLWLPATLSIVGDQIIAPIDPARPHAVYRLMVELE